MAYDPQVWFYVLSGTILALCAVLVHWWEGQQRITRLFVGYSSTLVLWSIVGGAMACTTDPALLMRLGRYEYALVAVASAQMFHALLLQLRAEEQASVAVTAVWVFAIALATVSMTLPFTVDGVVERRWGLGLTLGPVGILVPVWQGLMLAYLDIMLLRAWRRSHRGSAERSRLKGVCWMLLFLHLGPMDFIHDATGWLYPASFLSVTLMGVVMTWVTLRHGLMNADLSQLADKVLSRIGDGVIIIGNDGHIMRCNATAAELLGRSATTLPDLPVEQVFGRGKGVGWLQSLAQGELHKDQYLSIPMPDQEHRELLIDVSLSRDRHGRLLAATCRLRDRTDTRRRERARIDQQQRDPLTDALSRSAFKELIRTLPSAGDRPAYSVLVAGPRDFRALRARLGPIGADNELQALASSLRRVSGSEGTVARIGDDEFALLLGDSSGFAEARRCAEELLDADREDTAIAIVAAAETLADPARLMKGISIARRGALGADPGEIYWLNDDAVKAHGHLETELRTAIVDGQLAVHYQPVVDVRHRCITGFEALVRWQHPERGLLLPDTFMPLAEELGLVSDIDRAVIRTALSDISAFRRLAPALDLRVNVNLSRECIERPDFLDEMVSLFRDSGAQPAWMQLEILEGAIIDQGAQERLAALSKAGFTLGVDDFGTGYSSLSRLHQLPIGILKIDRSFVLALDQDKGESIVRGIASIGRRLGLRLVAEGVEDWSDVQRLMDMECALFQGFLFSPAVSADTVTDWLERGSLPWSMSPGEPGDANPETLILALA